MFSSTHFGASHPKPILRTPKKTFSGPPHQPNISFGAETPKAEPTAKAASTAPKKQNTGKKAVGFFKWMMLGLAGTAAAGGYIDNSNKIDQLNKQNAALQTQLNSATPKTTVGLNELADLVAKVSPANVMVKGKYGLGSGTWLQDKAGNLYVLTNHHVVEDNSLRGADSPPTFEIRLHNGSDIENATKVEGQLIKLANGKYAESADHDLALIGISTPNFKLPSHIKPLQFRDMKAEPLRAGEFVVVVGTPHGLTDNVTHGIVSHVERKLQGFEEANIFIGVDSPINPGNSGGSCYDLQGRYLGPPTAGMRGADGMGFVIRTDVVQDVLAGWGIHTQ